MADLQSLEAYVDRPIAYYELIRVGEWQLKTYRIGDFAHKRSEGREGMWMLLNWWTGGEMLQTHVYFCGYPREAQIQRASHEGGLICVWELEVVLHERKAWIKHALQKEPDRDAYLEDIYIQEKR